VSEIEAFGKALHTVESREQFIELVKHYGVRRTHPQIWEHFNWFVDYMRREQPVEAGVYDLNRYKKVSDLIADLKH
jgi:hypothetical protein